jgi:hypothetical protein
LERLEFKNVYKVDPGCNLEKNKEIQSFVENTSNFYLIYGGETQVVLSGKKFKNEDVNFFNKSLDAKRRFKGLNENSDISLEIFNTIKYLSIYSKKLYLIYPVPELGFNPNLVRGLKNLKKTDNLTISKTSIKKELRMLKKFMTK